MHVCVCVVTMCVYKGLELVEDQKRAAAAAATVTVQLFPSSIIFFAVGSRPGSSSRVPRKYPRARWFFGAFVYDIYLGPHFSVLWSLRDCFMG